MWRPPARLPYWVEGSSDSVGLSITTVPQLWIFYCMNGTNRIDLSLRFITTGSDPPLPTLRRNSPLFKSFVYVSGLFLGRCPSCLAKPPCLGQSRSLNTVFFSLSGGVPPSFLFRFRRLSDIYLGDPAAFVVDKFFPSAFSPHSLLSTNAVVGRSYTCSIISFHNSPRSSRIA
jgi:hypothetical protein